MLRKAIHQLRARMGKVATMAQMKGRVKSAIRPRAAKRSQKILRCMVGV